MRKLTAICLALLVTAGGCSSRVEYGDAQARETVTADFGSSDLQQIAGKLVDDLLAFDPVMKMTREGAPVVFVDRINNKTTEHIDTEAVTDSIQTKLIQSGQFRFVEPSKRARVREELTYQNQSGEVRPDKASRMGQKIGADMMLYGNLAGITKRDDNTKDVYYKFTLKLLNLETGIIEWAGEKEIRKTRSNSLFGL
jgi:uncharacterized protein (TIGR02722 family)